MTEQEYIVGDFLINIFFSKNGAFCLEEAYTRIKYKRLLALYYNLSD